MADDPLLSRLGGNEEQIFRRWMLRWLAIIALAQAFWVVLFLCYVLTLAAGIEALRQEFKKATKPPPSQGQQQSPYNR